MGCGASSAMRAAEEEVDVPFDVNNLRPGQQIHPRLLPRDPEEIMRNATNRMNDGEPGRPGALSAYLAENRRAPATPRASTSEQRSNRRISVEGQRGSESVAQRSRSGTVANPVTPPNRSSLPAEATGRPRKHSMAGASTDEVVPQGYHSTDVIPFPDASPATGNRFTPHHVRSSSTPSTTFRGTPSATPLGSPVPREYELSSNPLPFLAPGRGPFLTRSSPRPPMGFSGTSSSSSSRPQSPQLGEPTTGPISVYRSFSQNTTTRRRPPRSLIPNVDDRPIAMTGIVAVASPTRTTFEEDVDDDLENWATDNRPRHESVRDVSRDGRRAT